MIIGEAIRKQLYTNYRYVLNQHFFLSRLPRRVEAEYLIAKVSAARNDNPRRRHRKPTSITKNKTVTIGEAIRSSSLRAEFL